MAHLHTKLPACANCHYSFVPGEPDEFCPHCGQQNHEVNIGFGHVVEEFLEGVFHFDSKVFRTAGLLLFKPGQLTKRFLEGYRTPYVPPIRLYILISFVFFALLSQLQGHREDGKRRIADMGAKPTAYVYRGSGSQPLDQRRHDSILAVVKQEIGPDLANTARASRRIRNANFNISGLPFTPEEVKLLPEEMTDRQVDSVIRGKGATPGYVNRKGVRTMVRWRDVTVEEGIRQLFRGASILLFLLMPLAALLLKSVYFRQHRYYVSHLIFTVHVHCFLFVFLGILMLLDKVPQLSTLNGFLLLIPVAYFLVALHTFYQQSWVQTFLKSLLLGAAYSLVLFGTFLIVSLGGLLYF